MFLLVIYTLVLDRRVLGAGCAEIPADTVLIILTAVTRAKCPQWSYAGLVIE